MKVAFKIFQKWKCTTKVTEMLCLTITDFLSFFVSKTSAESPGIFLLLQKLLCAQDVGDLKEVALQQNFTDDEWQVCMH